MSYISQAATTTWHWICWFGVTLFLVCASLLVTPVLVVWFARDFLPKRRSKPLTSRPQNLRRLPHLRRDGSNVFWEMPDGAVIHLEGMESSQVLQEVAEVVGGALTYEMTRLRGDTEDAAPRL